MYYVIGPERSAEALARKVGLREEEWRPVRAVGDLIMYAAFSRRHNRFLVTHDAWQLGDYNEIMSRVREQDVAPARV